MHRKLSLTNPHPSCSLIIIIIIMKSQEYVVDTCFIRREDRFMTHPCCISASSKSPPSTPLILSRFRHKASSKITCKSHLHTTFIQKCPSLLSFQQSKEIPIWNKCWLENDWQLHIKTFFYNWGIGINETSFGGMNGICLIYSRLTMSTDTDSQPFLSSTSQQQCILPWSFPQNQSPQGLFLN